MGLIKEIPQPKIPPYQDAVYKGDTRVRSLRELKIGGGENILKVNTDGLFMGADNFADAPFSVDYDGNITVTTLTIADGSITTSKLADEAVTAGKIKSGDITATQIASNTITASKIKANTITSDELTTGAFVTSSANISSGVITEAKIGSAAVTEAKIGSAAVTNAKIKNAAVTNAKIGSAAVTNAKIKNATIGYAKIASVNATTITTGTLTGRTIRTVAPASGTGSAVVIEGGSDKRINFYYGSTWRGFIRGYTTDGAEVTYIGIEGSSGRKLELKNSYVSCNGNFLPNADNSHTMGSSSKRWSDGRFEDITVDDLFVETDCTGCAYQEINLLTDEQISNLKEKRNKEAKLKGRKADDVLAEQKKNREDYRKYNPTGFKTGDVLVWENNELQKCNTDASRLVVAISSKKGFPIVLGAEAVRVVGKCKKGDMLVTSNTSGCARVWDSEEEPPKGIVIAMALENKKDDKCGLVKSMIQKM